MEPCVSQAEFSPTHHTTTCRSHQEKNKQLPACLQPMKNHDSPPQDLSFLHKHSPSLLFIDQPMFQ